MGTHVVETNARCLIETIRQVPGPRHLCLEEGTLSEWLYEMLSPHSERVVVAAVRESRGPKDDRRDAFGLADGLRLGAMKRRVYKERGRFGALGYRAKGYRLVRGDLVRVKNRLRSLYRSRGVPATGRSVYAASSRGEFVGRPPGAAQPLPIVVTPYRFQSKRGFWSYCGLGIVMRRSSDWMRTLTGEWVKAEVKRTLGLNPNFNHTLKAIFKGAATTVIGRAEDERLRCVGTGISTVQGRASIGILVRASWSESPGIGYAPLESRTMQWAMEPPIEGWFPPPDGERSGCDRIRNLAPVRGRAAIERSVPLCEPPCPAAEATDAGRQNHIGQRVVDVCLDGLPHRRESKRRPRSERRYGGVFEATRDARPLRSQGAEPAGGSTGSGSASTMEKDGA